MYEIVNFGGWPHCIRLNNDESELIITTDVGPRIIRFGFINRQNFFHLNAEDAGKTGGDKWRIYGGHRLWIAPEEIPGTYYPDNNPVAYTCSEYHVSLSQQETTSGIVKEMEITLSPGKNEVTVSHRFINQSSGILDLSLWALSVLAIGGRAIIPQEPYGEGDDYLLPCRSMALWQYTKMDDPRWTWGAKYIQARPDPAIASEQKIGVLNKQQWVAYYLEGELLIKQFPFDPKAIYPDFGCNNEVYINGNFLEIETLGPMTSLRPGGIMEHTEHWFLAEANLGESEDSITANVSPLVNSFIAQFK